MDAVDRLISQLETPKYSSKKPLDEFWADFYAAQTAKGRLNVLRRMANVRLNHPKEYKVRRLKFNKSKRKCGLRVGSKPCELCGSERATQRHHVILLVNGGPNQRRNLIALCHACHADIHPWMARPKIIANTA
jgi:5-methylcytosine-specific restriction endonuclease McrA